MSNYTENKTPNLIINTVEDPSKLSEITVGENEIVLVPDDTEEEIAKKQDKLVAGTNITLVDDPLTQTTLISSTAQESFFRGNFNEWSDVPTDTSLYHEDIHGNRIPQGTDFIVIEDASQFIPVGELMHTLAIECSDLDVRITDETGVLTEYNYTYCPNTFVAIDNYYSLKYEYGAPGHWYIKTNDGSPIVVKGVTYQSGQVFLFNTDERGTIINAGMPPSAGQYTGAWRFAYYGTWSTDGKAGWIPQYKIENTLPIADSSTLGIAKLYNTTGQNIDGSITQKLFTDTTDNKLDDVKIYGTSNVDRPTKTANLNVVEQCDQTTMPVPSQDLLGRIVQYIGPNGLVSGYVHGYFYECQYVTTESYIELEVIKQPGTQLDTVTCDKDLLEANQGTTTNSWTFISRGGWNEWYLDDEHIDLNDWGIAYQGEPSEDDEIDLDYTEASGRYIWVAIPVQPDAEPISSQEINALWE